MHFLAEGKGRRWRGVAPVLIGLFVLSIVPGTAIAQESVWTDLAPAKAPSARDSHDMAYDAESDRIVLFGGRTAFGRGLKDDTWAYDFNANEWTNMTAGTRPSPRYSHAMAYDAESDRVILYGGTASSPETWAYNLNANTWTNMSPAIQPTAWSFVAAAYDAESDRIVLFGGCAADNVFSCIPPGRHETWSYNYNANAWTNMNPGTRPPARAFSAMAYDAESDRIVLFGGARGPLMYLADTWAYNLNANSWTEMNPQEAPGRRDGHGMAYDANADRIVLFGGTIIDTWTYDFNSDTWTQTGGIGAGPSIALETRLAYDTESDSMVSFGGGTGGPSSIANDETWVHRLVPTADPIPAWVYLAIGVVAAAVVAVVAVYLIRRSKRIRKGEGGE